MHNELTQLDQITQSEIDKQIEEINSQTSHLDSYTKWVGEKKILFAAKWDAIVKHIRKVGFEIAEDIKFSSLYYQYKNNVGDGLLDYSDRFISINLRCKCVGRYKPTPKSYYSDKRNDKARKIEEKLTIFEGVRFSVNQYSFEYDPNKGQTEETTFVLITVSI